jgi:hypothetical protein
VTCVSLVVRTCAGAVWVRCGCGCECAIILFDKNRACSFWVQLKARLICGTRQPIALPMWFTITLYGWMSFCEAKRERMRLAWLGGVSCVSSVVVGLRCLVRRADVPRQPKRGCCAVALLCCCAIALWLRGVDEMRRRKKVF